MTPRLQSDRPFFDRLYTGTLRSLRDRVRENGFCPTSFGEENGVQTYPECHYPRDAAEAAQVLADTGETEKALRILEFNLHHIPSGQDYIPHVYDSSGGVIHNNLQTDTPAHSALALELLARGNIRTETAERIAALYRSLDRLAGALWRKHFRKEFQLLDSGNFNEQGFGGTREPLLDFFSNAANHAGFRALARIAEKYGDDRAARKHDERAEMLASGIEAHLFDPEENRYSAAITPGGERMKLFNWLSIYPYRFYAGRTDAWECAFERLWNETANDWHGLRIPCCEPPHLSLRTLGKVVAVLMRYCAETGRRTKLAELFSFIETTVRRPADLWPEFWYHHAPGPEDSPYFRDLFAHFSGIWVPFTEDPAGDHTVDSGNCEQSAVFCNIFLNYILGCRRTENGGVLIAPTLPAFHHATLEKRPLPDGGFLSWELEQSAGQCKLTLRTHAANAGTDVELLLPVPAGATDCLLFHKQVPCPMERLPLGEYDLCRITLPAAKRSREFEEFELNYHHNS